MAHNIELGRRGEITAAYYLEKSNYEILERNWRCRAGEADIICEAPEGALVFVEVKTRTNTNSGWPEEAVDDKKRAKYEKIALNYLAEHEEYDDAQLRFDMISIVVLSNNRASIRHHVNCF